MAKLSLYSLSNNKADKATTLIDYGITDAYTKLEIDNNLLNKIDNSQKGVANGIATLNDLGKVPLEQLPDSVGANIFEYDTLADFPTAGETAKIYVARDFNKLYRWDGSVYIEISPGSTDVYTKTEVDTALSGNIAGNAASATKLATSRTIAVTGDVVGSASFDGSANASITSVLNATGVSAGTYKILTVDNKGRVIAGSNPNTISGYGITDVYSMNEIDARIGKEQKTKLGITASTSTPVISSFDLGADNTMSKIPSVLKLFTGGSLANQITTICDFNNGDQTSFGYSGNVVVFDGNMKFTALKSGNIAMSAATPLGDGYLYSLDVSTAFADYNTIESLSLT